MTDTPARCLGVDACRKGWVGIDSDGRAHFGAHIDELLRRAEADGPLDVIAIDIPIGLSRNGSRAADALARAAVGPRRSSVFQTPVLGALRATTYAEANAVSRQAAGVGISQQGYALRAKILEVNDWVAGCGRTVIEVHPEVSFATLAGRHLVHPKSTWAGVEERRTLLAAVGLAPSGDLGEAGAKAGVDDVLDAAALWTAIRYAAGDARSLPDPPERLDDGPLAAIWF